MLNVGHQLYLKNAHKNYFVGMLDFKRGVSHILMLDVFHRYKNCQIYPVNCAKGLSWRFAAHLDLHLCCRTQCSVGLFERLKHIVLFSGWTSSPPLPPLCITLWRCFPALSRYVYPVLRTFLGPQPTLSQGITLRLACAKKHSGVLLLT